MFLKQSPLPAGKQWSTEDPAHIIFLKKKLKKQQHKSHNQLHNMNY